MPSWNIEVVPDSAPNADGVWETVELSVEPNFDYVPRPGHHIVAVSLFRPEPEPPYLAGNQAGYHP